MQARRQFGLAGMAFAASAAAVCWAPLGVLGGNAWASIAAGTVGMLGMVLVATMMAEGIRLLRLSRYEARWEWERSIRPKL
jgi:hypothetical protein